jgi:uncharacterized membrane protein (UPF0127 family)
MFFREFLGSLFSPSRYVRGSPQSPLMRNSLFALLALFLSAFLLQAAPKPQFDLPKATLTLGTNSLDAQIAADDSSRERGLMSRTNLAENEAMLFVFPRPQPVAFWMKDTPVPLSIAYVGPSGRIFEIHDLKPFDETPVPSASEAVVYAIEVPQGWFARRGVMAGSLVGGLPTASSAK